MANWEKIVGSGSGVSQLANDSGYVSSIGGGLVSSSAQVTALLPDGTVSGSSQVTISSTTGYTSFSSSIATDITSNTTEISSVSSSFSTRITAQEDFSSSLDATFATDAELSALSSSASTARGQVVTDYIAADSALSSSASTARGAIASDLSSISSSLSTRIAAQEEFSSSLDTTFVTEAELVAATSSLSASLAVDIATNASDIADLVTDSGSFSTRVTSLEDFSSSLDATFATDAELSALSSSASTARNQIATDYIAADSALSSSASTARDQIATDYIAADSALSSSASTSRNALASDISTNTSDIATLNGKTLVSGSTFSSPSQGTLRATINGVATDVDLGLQAADNVTFADAVITGDLTVQGTASFQNTTDLDVADRFIRLASGSNANGDGGIVVQQDSPANGEAFAFDTAESRWGVTSSFDPTTNTIVPDAFMTTNVTGADNDPTGIAGRYQKNGNIFVGNTGDIWIYS